MRPRCRDEVMRRFVAGEVGVLCSTMIVEAGLDVPNANAMIVHHAEQFGLAFRGRFELDPDIRKGGDTGHPVALEGEDSPHAQSLFAFARRVRDRVQEIKSSQPESVIQIH